MAWAEHTLDGISYLEREGSGPCVVMLHGIGSNAHAFTGITPHLPADLRLIAWNAPGYLGSAPLDALWPVAADYANMLLGHFDGLGLTSAHLVGHSLGALMGAAFAANNPARVDSLLLASPALGHRVPRGGSLSAAAQARIDDLDVLGPKAFAQSRAERLVFEPEKNPNVLETVRRAMAAVRLPGYRQAVRMLASGRLLDDAQRLAVPTAVMVGMEDVVTPPDGAQRLFVALPSAWRGGLTQVPAAGHALYQQTPTAFAETLIHHITDATRWRLADAS
ncbi:MAG: alpha/beta fold hydrolase [Pseudomonadota bacterium]